MKYKLLALLATLTACSNSITPENALEKLAQRPEHQQFYYAPIHIGRQVLSGENHQNLQTYIDQNYGSLVAEGFITIQEKEKNAWRTVVEIELTEKGKTFIDPKRTDKEHAFVAICQLLPDSLLSIQEITKDSVTCIYLAKQTNITPFGKNAGFEDGKQHKIEINLKK